MNDEQKIELAEKVVKYCKKFNIAIEYLFHILEDQKVTPMIRGKAMEYNAFLLLKGGLPNHVWNVQKLNLNAQNGVGDEDVGITHLKTGITLKVESKSAVRGSMSTGKRARILKEPHFKVKCHRSRSNIELADSTNDQYSVDSFDVIVTNTANAIFEGNTVGEILEVIDDDILKEMLYQFYNVENDIDLIARCEIDWRFCIPKDIAINGFIPRKPYVKLYWDANWLPLSSIEDRLNEVVMEKRKLNKSTRQ